MVDVCAIIEQNPICEFERCTSLRGYPYYVWNRTMPRISDDILDCVIYLYPSVMDAQEGEHFGGSGFLVAVRFEVYESRSMVYAVTNSHVIREAASPIIRLNTIKGAHDVLEIAPQTWHHHPDGDDLAVCPLGLSPELYKFKCIPSSMFITQDLVSQYNIGPGDEVFVAGRFVNHEGKQRNLPSLRFGNIAMMPYEPIRHERGFDQESFLIEARSIPGYSGSPVFVHILPFSKRPKEKGWQTEKGPWLLGVDWSHLPLYKPVLEKNLKHQVPERWKVETNSGMAGVIPAWRLRQLLDIEEFVVQRKKLGEVLAKQMEQAA